MKKNIYVYINIFDSVQVFFVSKIRKAVVQGNIMVLMYKMCQMGEKSYGLCLHLGLAVRWPGGVILVLLADELVRFLGCLLCRDVAPLGILSLELVARQVLNDTCADGVSQDVGGGTQPITVGEEEGWAEM